MSVPDLSRGWLGRRSATAFLVLALAALVVIGVVLVTPRGGDRPSGEPVVSRQADPTAPPIVGEEYAVSPDGDDEASGSPDDPWRTLQHALQQLRAGDRLTVADGRYRENVEVQVRPGREDAPVQVVAADGARPLVVGLLWLEDLSWWDVRGLNVTWDDDNGDNDHMVKLTDGEGWRFADAELWGARSTAALLVAGEPEDFTLSGLYVHDTEPTNDNNQDHLVYLNPGTGGGVLERSILARSDNGRAVKVGTAEEGDGEVGNIVIRYVTMVDNRGPSNVQLAWEASGVTVENSIMVGSAEGRNSVTAFQLDGTDNVVRDNVSWDSAGVLDDDPGLQDGGGNIRVDPRLSGPDAERPYYPRAPEAQAYGRWAADQ